MYPVIEYKYTIEFTIPESSQPTIDQDLHLHYGRVCKPIMPDENAEGTLKKHDRRRQRKEHLDKRRNKRQVYIITIVLKYCDYIMILTTYYLQD